MTSLSIGYPPVIVLQPEDAAVKAGQVTFAVAATGATGRRWQYLCPGEPVRRNVSAIGTSATYTLTATARHSGYTCRCKLTNANGTVCSAAVKLTVN